MDVYADTGMHVGKTETFRGMLLRMCRSWAAECKHITHMFVFEEHYTLFLNTCMCLRSIIRYSCPLMAWYCIHDNRIRGHAQRVTYRMTTCI